MEISVIVPVHNAENTLQRTLNALANQDMDSFEVILVNNGSTDASEIICKKMSELDARFRYVYTAIRGVSNARNLGIENSYGRYLYFCDADDVPDIHMLSTIYHDILRYKADFVMCNYYSERDQRMSNFPESMGRVLNKEDIKAKLIPLMFGCNDDQDVIWGTVWRGIFKRDLISSVDLKFDTKLSFAEDLCFVLEYLMIAENVVLEDSNLYFYSMTDGSAMLSYNKYKPQLFNERLYLIARLRDILTCAGIYAHYRDTVDTVFQEYILECIGNACINGDTRKWSDVYKSVAEITHSELVKDVFCSITTIDKKHRVIFQLIKHQMDLFLAIYYSFRKR